MKEINWAMIGCGQVTEVKSGPGLYKSEGSNLIAVFDLSFDRAKDYAKRHGIEKVYEKVEDILVDEEVDIVYIATPPKFHKQYAIACLETGKIPYIEKPVAINYSECLEIKELAEKKNIPAYVAFYRRGMEKFLKIKELVEAGEIGDVRAVSLMHTMPVEDSELDRNNLPWRLIKDISGGGKFLDMDVHILDVLELILGEMEDAKGFYDTLGGYYEVDDTVVASFKFKNGVVGSGVWSYVADKIVDRVEIIGSSGRIVFAGLPADKFTVDKDGVKEEFYFETPEHVAMPYQQAVVNELLGIKNSEASFEQAINLVKMTDKIYGK